MELLDTIASINDRKVGSAAGAAARQLILDYIRRKIPKAHISLETFDLMVLSRFCATVETTDGSEHAASFSAHVYDNTGVDGAQTVTGQLYAAGLFLWPWQRRGARGKIVVYQYSGIVHRMLQVKIALEAGARAVILVARSPGCIPKGLGYPAGIGECPIIAVGLTQSQWVSFKQAHSPEHPVTIQYQRHLEPVHGTNIVVDLAGGGGSAASLVIGAHYDSWYAGWLDNSVAVHMLADLLTQLAAAPTALNVRGIFFDAEEVGLLGSGYHVAHNDLSLYRFYLNLEMPIPARNGRLRLLLHKLAGPLRRAVTRGGLSDMGFVALPISLIYRLVGGFPADIHHFYLKRIPCLTTFCSHPFYHTPWDNRDNLRLDLYDGVKEELLHILRRIDHIMADDC